MADQRVLDRIRAWQAAGLIDGVTADRLRIAEASAPVDAGATDAAAGPPSSATAPPSRVGSVFGPSPTISELFAYVAEQTSIGVALLVEGVILLGGGLAADRLRRRLARSRAVVEVAAA